MEYQFHKDVNFTYNKPSVLIILPEEAKCNLSWDCCVYTNNTGLDALSPFLGSQITEGGKNKVNKLNNYSVNQLKAPFER